MVHNAKSSPSSKVAPLGTDLLTAGSTTVAMEHPMWVMPASEFIHLSELRPHEELRAEGKVVRCDPSQTVVFYVSHQWTSSSHPDYSTAQLRAFQSLILRIVHGTLPKTAPTFVDASRLPANVTISTNDWQNLVKHAFIWMDYLSVRLSWPHAYVLSSRIVFPGGDRCAWRGDACGVRWSLAQHFLSRLAYSRSFRFASRSLPCTRPPQTPQTDRSNERPTNGIYGQTERFTDQERATRSISAYIERCSHFFVLCPSVKNRHNPDVIYDFSSWLKDSACHVELSALLLARRHCIPAIVSALAKQHRHVADMKHTHRSAKEAMRRPL